MLQPYLSNKRTLIASTSLCLVMLFCVSNSFAETGDELVITGSIVNLRTAPSNTSNVAIKLLKDKKVSELQRNGEWVEIETGREDVKTGWVHASLVARAEIEATIAEQIAASEKKRFKYFKQRFQELNEITTKHNGKVYFSEVREEGESNIEVIATETWLNAEVQEKQDTLSVLFKLWSELVPVGSSFSVLVFDEQGDQHMMMLR